MVKASEPTPLTAVFINFPAKGLVISHTIGGLAKDIAASMTRPELELFINLLIEAWKGQPEPGEGEGDSKPNPEGGKGNDEHEHEHQDDKQCQQCGGKLDNTGTICDSCIEDMISQPGDMAGEPDQGEASGDASDGEANGTADAVDAVKQILGTPETKHYSEQEVLAALKTLGIELS